MPKDVKPADANSRGPARYYLGLATTFHDPALAIVAPDGEVLFAEATERYLQYKRAVNCEPDSTPRMAALLAQFVPPDAELVVATTWGEGISSQLGRMAAKGSFDLATIAGLGSQIGTAMTPESTERAYAASLHLRQAGAGLGTLIGMERAFGSLRFGGHRPYRHHDTHAAFAAFGSPFDDAGVLVIDGVGEGSSVSLYHWRNGCLQRLPGGFGTLSPGLMYAILTDACGFDSMTGEEWKVMGLAPYGRPDPGLASLVRQLFRIDERGRPLRAAGDTIRSCLDELRAARTDLAETGGWADLARASQDVFVEVMDRYVAVARERLPTKDFVLTGGCALNSSYNGQLTERYGLRQLHVPSAPGDDGNAIGAALLAWSDDHPGAQAALGSRPLTPYLGSAMSTDKLDRMRRQEPRLVRLGDAVVERTAELLATGSVVAWAQGRAEFGPRALGNRSILADPRPANAKDTLNAKVKYREAFRPFAPSILAEHAHDWFENAQESPYMDRTLRWKASASQRVPAVVHEDGTGRLQTVQRQSNERFYELITAFERRTGVPIVLNTSLNVMGKPIAHTTEDALMLFYTTGIDALVVDDWLLTKSTPMD